jgi:hypothetical protein
MRAGAKMLTWKVWTHQQNDPVFEGTEEQARTYIILNPPACDGAVLESPDGDSYGYQRGTWVSLDGAWSD